MARIRGRRADGSPQASPEGLAPGAEQSTEVAPAIVATAETPAPASPAAEPIPAGADPAEAAAPARPGFRDRGRLRRRLRYLRRLRELAFRDLGGLVFDLHRFGRERDDLVRAKLEALDAIDRELRALEEALDEAQPVLELREPGIAACPRCGTLHGSEARFCPNCALPLADGGVAAPAVATSPAAAPPDAEPASAIESASGATAGDA